MKSRLFIVAMMVVALLIPAQAQAPTQVFKRFTAQTATGYTANHQFAQGSIRGSNDEYVVIGGFIPQTYTITITPTGSPTTCTYQVYGTLKRTAESPVEADFTGGELHPVQDCTAKVSFTVTSKSFPTLVGRLVSLAGGSTPTVQLEILGR